MGRANAHATHRAAAFAQHAHHSSADVSHMHTAGSGVSRAVARVKRQRARREPRGMVVVYVRVCAGVHVCSKTVCEYLCIYVFM